MKKILAAIFLFCSAFVYSQDQQEMMQAWMDYMTPSTMHEILTKIVGEWKAEMTLFDMMGGMQTKAEGTAKVESILGGRYFITNFKSMMMGMPFEGLGIDGYDNKEQKFYTYWIDNMGTGMLIMKGDYDKNTKTFTYTGNSTNPMNGNPIPMRSITKIIDDNKFINEMYTTNEGKEYKMFEIVYTRK